MTLVDECLAICCDDEAADTAVTNAMRAAGLAWQLSLADLIRKGYSPVEAAKLWAYGNGIAYVESLQALKDLEAHEQANLDYEAEKGDKLLKTRVA